MISNSLSPSTSTANAFGVEEAWEADGPAPLRPPGDRAPAARSNGVGRDGEYYLEYEEVDSALKKEDSGGRGKTRVSDGSAKALDMAVHDCATRITTAVHNAVVIPLALYALTDGQLWENCFQRTNEATHLLLAITGGYFIWDVGMCAYNIRTDGWPYFIHGLICAGLYAYGFFQGVFHLYGAVYLSWELSTPFVHLRWLLKLIGQENSRAYFWNGILMVLVFFLARIAGGYFLSGHFWYNAVQELRRPAGEKNMHAAWLFAYMLGNVMMNFLNTNWFVRMVKGGLKVMRRQTTQKAAKEQ